MMKFSKKKLKEEIMREARVLDLPSGAAEAVADEVAEKVKKWADKRTEITENDLNRVTAEALEEFNQDLSYVYKNRGKII